MRLRNRIFAAEERAGMRGEQSEEPLIIIRAMVASTKGGPRRTGEAFAYIPGGGTLRKNIDESDEAFELRAREAITAAKESLIEQRSGER